MTEGHWAVQQRPAASVPDQDGKDGQSRVVGRARRSVCSAGAASETVVPAAAAVSDRDEDC